jgi:hypothetical protein
MNLHGPQQQRVIVPAHATNSQDESVNFIDQSLEKGTGVRFYAREKRAKRRVRRPVIFRGEGRDGLFPARPRFGQNHPVPVDLANKLQHGVHVAIKNRALLRFKEMQ